MKDQELTCNPKHLSYEEEIKDAKLAIKTFIFSQKDGIPSSSLLEAYQSLTGEDIPLTYLGYRSLYHFLRDIPEIVSKCNSNGQHVLVVKPSEKTKHLHELIKNQKDPRTPKINTNKRTESKSKFYSNKRKETRHKIYSKHRNVSFDKKENEIEVPEDENWGRPIIYEQYDDRVGVCAEPIVGTSQLIGDDYFLQLLIKYSNYCFSRKDEKSAIRIGTVESGLTIRRAAAKLDKITSMSNRLVINLGTVDIYNRHSEEEMCDDYRYLLKKLRNKYSYSPGQITICTIPPMGNVSAHCDKDRYNQLLRFNNWIRKYATLNNYNLLDLHEEFTVDNMAFDYRYFQQNARNVSGTRHPHVLWNYWGRQKAMKLLLQRSF